jgi:bifunctional non-homologous end joining protein LigD
MSSRPAFVEPQLPTLVDQPPTGDGWIHEIKHDGYRTMLVLAGRDRKAFTRNGFDWSDRYQTFLNAAARLRCRSAILDGEVIVQDARGISDFEALKSVIWSRPERLVFYAFDLLYLNGKDLREESLLQRRAKLKELVGKDQSRIQFSDEFADGGAALFQACVEHGLEGIVSKLTASRDRSGRTNTWLRTKCFTESAFVIIGTARDRKTGAPLALLARAEEQRLAYAGSAFIAVSGKEREQLWTRLDAIKLERCPIANLRLADAQWVKPQLVARVRHLPGAKHLRHGTVRGFC